MKRITCVLAGIALMAAPAFARDYDEKVADEKAELRESQRELDKDRADIRHREEQLKQNRAEKARAKAEGNYGRQAAESVKIGANKAAIKSNKIERDINQEMVEEDLEDLRDLQQEKRNTREMSPAAGRNSQSYSNMKEMGLFPQERSLQEEDYAYWQGGRYESNRRY